MPPSSASIKLKEVWAQPRVPQPTHIKPTTNLLPMHKKQTQRAVFWPTLTERMGAHRYVTVAAQGTKDWTSGARACPLLPEQLLRVMSPCTHVQLGLDGPGGTAPAHSRSRVSQANWWPWIKDMTQEHIL